MGKEFGMAMAAGAAALAACTINVNPPAATPPAASSSPAAPAVVAATPTAAPARTPGPTATPTAAPREVVTAAPRPASATPGTSPTPGPGGTPDAGGFFNPSVRIEAFLNEAFARYDHGRDGAIALKKANFLMPDETQRKESTRREAREGGQVVRIVYTVYTYTMRDAFFAADADGNLQVTRAELAAVLGRYDKDQDGALTRRGFLGWLGGKPKGEYDEYATAYGERQADKAERTFEVADRLGMNGVEAEAPVVVAPTIYDETVKPAE